MRLSFVALLFLLLSIAISYSQTPKNVAAASADVDTKRTEILNYLASLSQNNAVSFQGAVSGQNCYYGSQILHSSSEDGFNSMVDALHSTTGKWVGILGVDYEFYRCFSPDQLTRTNQVLINYAQSGGLIAITFTPQNPWVNDESDILNYPGSWDGDSGTQNPVGMSQVTNLDDLLDPAQPVHAAWMRKLDRIAQALKELRDAGVIVLFRPMQEMNGNWFWWGLSSHPDNPLPYIDVYRHMHDYFSRIKGLNNLLWVYSPSASFGQDKKSTWCRPVDWAYPGSDYVDIVAGTSYNDDAEIADYSTYVKMDKPLGMAELGPQPNGQLARQGTWDTHNIIAAIKTKYPRIAYWVCWQSYPKQCWSIISNKNPSALMQDPNVINRDKLPSWD